MLGHVVLITLGYAAGSSLGLWGTIVDFVVDYPGMLLAVAGTAALVMVVVTSVKKARRRLRYESWHLIHLYGYLGAGLALPHQLWTGTDFLASTTATVFWWSLYVAVRRRGARLPGLAPALALAAFTAARPRRARRGRRRHHGDRRWPWRAPDAGARRAVLPVALPRRSGLDARQPLLHLGGPRRRDPAVHCRARG